MLANEYRPRPGIIAAGQPGPSDLARWAAEGATLVVNLRGADEVPSTWGETVRAAGVKYEHLPIVGPGDLNADNARRLGALLAGNEGTTVVHCGSSNRVGGLLALWAHVVGGEDPRSALAFGKQAGLAGSEADVRSQLGL